MTLICMKMKLHAELIFIWKVSHLDSFWKRDTRGLGNGLLIPYYVTGSCEGPIIPYSLFETHLQGIMVVVFLICDWKYNYHDSLQGVLERIKIYSRQYAHSHWSTGMFRWEYANTVVTSRFLCFPRTISNHFKAVSLTLKFKYWTSNEENFSLRLRENRPRRFGLILYS